ncbi:hypothetical protein ACVW1B_002178 [Bradyrhizobium sp. USDA 4502]
MATARLDAWQQLSENELAGAWYQGRHRGDRRHGRTRRSERGRALAASTPQSSGPGPRSVENKAEDQGSMEQAEHDLLADLRRARRSLRLQDLDEPAAVARLTLGRG